jgi:CubicO group peptidase (beta-lactamase class C family)
MSRRTRIVASAAAVLALLAVIWYAPAAWRLYRVVHLYDEDRIAHNFLHMEDLFPVRVVRADAEPSRLRRGAMELPEFFELGGERHGTAEYLDYSRTTGMVVLRGDEILYEGYWLGHDESGRHISWSVAKSFVSALVGIALEEGRFASVEDPITRYLPQLARSGYDGVRIKDILQMSSGVGFNEDYADYDSDINRFGRTIALGTPMADFVVTLKRQRAPGTYQHYVSIDTQVLGMLLRQVTGQSLADYLQSRLWQPLGMERDAYWLIDSTGMEVALGGLNASLRDYARFGLLYLDGGRRLGTQIVPAQWIADSTRPDAAHLMPGANNPASSSSWGYGYQWWIPDPDQGDFLAAGIYNQYIYVNPAARVVIAKNSANHRFTQERQESKDLHVALFRAVAAAASRTP